MNSEPAGLVHPFEGQRKRVRTRLSRGSRAPLIPGERAPSGRTLTEEAMHVNPHGSEDALSGLCP